MGLWYTKDSGFELTKFSDADYAGCKDTFKSTSGGAQFLGEKLVSWSLKKQDSTALFTAKAEYVSLSACRAQVIWMRTQLTDYGCHFKKIPIYYDTKSAIAISCNPVQHSRTKHIAVCYHFIKEHVEKGTIKLYFVKTDYQLADLFTKALPLDRFNYLVLCLGLRNLSPHELERLAKSHQNRRDLPRDTPLDRVEVLRSTRFYRLSHSEIVDIEKVAVPSSLRLPNNKLTRGTYFETTKKIIQIKNKIEATRDRQKSYADVRRKPLEFQVGDKVMLKVSPWKGVIRFGKRGKLNPRYIEPFKCLSEEMLVILLEDIQIDDKLHFIEELVEIMDQEVKRLKQSRILIFKVRWNSRRGPEFTWEREDQFPKPVF
ncbi:hypothetical protein Tco_0885170 [Tanacetum coccineum]